MSEITFRRADTPDHYKMCHQLMREEQEPKQVLGFPTIMAFQDQELVGICGTHIVDDLVVAGPLILRSDKRRAFTALRLCVEYEAEMRRLGIKSFIFSAEIGSVMEEAVDRYMINMKPYAEKGSRKFYIRKIEDGQFGISPRPE